MKKRNTWLIGTLFLPGMACAGELAAETPRDIVVIAGDKVDTEEFQRSFEELGLDRWDAKAKLILAHHTPGHDGDGKEEAAFVAEADKKAIEKVIEDYFDGIGAADAERLNRAFAVKKATMVGMRKDGEGGYRFTAWKEMAPVIADWADHERPEGTGRDGEILAMNVTDGRIAAVTFRYKDEYYDVLTLLKVDGVWKIVTKTFVER